MVVAALAVAVTASEASPCGGSQVDWVDGPLLPVRQFVERTLSPLDGLDYMVRDELRFLPGIVTQDSARVTALLARAPFQPWFGDSTIRPLVPEPDDSALRAAWARGDVEAAVGEATAIVSRVMALPAAAIAARDEALRLAVETIELGPLTRDVPASARAARFETLASPFRTGAIPEASAAARAARAPSLAYATLLETMRARVPNGGRPDVSAALPSAAWDSLHAQQRQWLVQHRTHPCAGLVSFLRLRTFFLASQGDSAWATAIRLYADWPARAAAEMRYLLLTGLRPSDAVLRDARLPRAVRVSLVGNLRPAPATWEALMREAATAPSARWSENLQERLLAMLVTDTIAVERLPEAFPAWRPTASLLWRVLHAGALLRAGRAAEALPFTSSTLVDARDSVLSRDAAALAVRIHLQLGDWRRALEVPGADPWARRYLLRALAPDSVVPTLVASRDPWLVREARLVLATRAARGGRWEEAAAAVMPVDRARAARYRRLGALARDTATEAGLLAFARGAAAMHGQLFYEARRYFHRGIVSRDWSLSAPEAGADDWDLPWTRRTERARQYAYLRESAERYLALGAYAAYLQRPGLTAAARRTAVREADRVYNGLLATDPSRVGDGYWGDSLATLPAARVLRAAGRR